MLSRNPAAAVPPQTSVGSSTRRAYLTLLPCAFALFSSMRVVAYLPTLWVIHTSGDSSQHSLMTWCTWLGANITMAACLYEQNGCRANAAVLTSLSNAAMCTGAVVLIAWWRV